MYLDKKQNILKTKKFSFIFVPIITILFAILNNFVPSFTNLDKTILLWLTIGLSSFIGQYIMTIKLKVKHIALNYLYILISINISLFFGYILERYLVVSSEWWNTWILDPFSIFFILFLIKEITWLFISFAYKRKLNKDHFFQNTIAEKNELESKIEFLENEIEIYKSKLDEKNNKSGL